MNRIYACNNHNQFSSNFCGFYVLLVERYSSYSNDQAIIILVQNDNLVERKHVLCSVLTLRLNLSMYAKEFIFINPTVVIAILFLLQYSN